MGEVTFQVQRDTLADLFMALLQWRGWNIAARDVQVKIFPVARPGERENSAYRAVVTYVGE